MLIANEVNKSQPIRLPRRLAPSNDMIANWFKTFYGHITLTYNSASLILTPKKDFSSREVAK